MKSSAASTRVTASASQMIHETAIVDPTATLAKGVSIGPYATVEAGAVLGAGCELQARAHVGRGVRLGPECEIHIGAVVGLPGSGHGPGRPAPLVAGARNVIREYTVVLGGEDAAHPTVMGDDNFIMGGAQIAAGARLGNETTVAPNVVVAGGVQIDDRAFVSGNVFVNEGIRIGRLAFISGLSAIYQDAPPFMIMGGRPAQPLAPNMTGMQRAGIPSGSREALKAAFKHLFRGDDPQPSEADLAALLAGDSCIEVRELVAFLRERLAK